MAEWIKAESRGICCECGQIIQVGDAFRWEGECPPAPVHRRCPEKPVKDRPVADKNQ